MSNKIFQFLVVLLLCNLLILPATSAPQGYSLHIYSPDTNKVLTNLDFGNINTINEYDRLEVVGNTIYYLPSDQEENIVSYNYEKGNMEYLTQHDDDTGLAYFSYILPNGSIYFYPIRSVNESRLYNIYDIQSNLVTDIKVSSQIVANQSEDYVSGTLTTNIPNQRLHVWYQQVGDFEYGKTEYVWFDMNTFEQTRFVADQELDLSSINYYMFNSTLYAIEKPDATRWNIHKLINGTWGIATTVSNPQEGIPDYHYNYNTAIDDMILLIERRSHSNDAIFKRQFIVKSYNLTSQEVNLHFDKEFTHEFCRYHETPENTQMNRTHQLLLRDYYEHQPQQLRQNGNLLLSLNSYNIEFYGTDADIRQIQEIDTCDNFRVRAHPISLTQQVVLQHEFEYVNVDNDDDVNISLLLPSVVLVVLSRLSRNKNRFY